MFKSDRTYKSITVGILALLILVTQAACTKTVNQEASVKPDNLSNSNPTTETTLDSPNLVDPTDNIFPDEKYTLEILMGEYGFRARGIKPGDILNDGDRFVIKGTLEGEKHIIITDVQGNIYKDVVREDASNALWVLTENRVLFTTGRSLIGDALFSEGQFYIYDFDNDIDVTDQYLENHGDFVCVDVQSPSGVNIFCKKVEETYNSKKTTIYVLNEKGDEKFSFTSDEIEQKYGVSFDWYSDTQIYSCGAGVYYIPLDGRGLREICFIDTIRNQAFAMNDLPQNNLGAIYSDGKYIIDYQPLQGMRVIDCQSTWFEPFTSSDYEPCKTSGGYKKGFSDGWIFCQGHWNDNRSKRVFTDIHGNVTLKLDYKDTYISNIWSFHNGCALVEFKRSFVSVINDKGEILFNPINCTFFGCYNVCENTINIIQDNNKYYVLDAEGNKIEVDMSEHSWCFAFIMDDLYIVNTDNMNKTKIN